MDSFSMREAEGASCVALLPAYLSPESESIEQVPLGVIGHLSP